MASSSVSVATQQVTRDLLAQFVDSHRLVKLFENLAADVSVTIPGAMDRLQDANDTTRSLAVLVHAIAQQALELAYQAVDAPVRQDLTPTAADLPTASPQVFEGFAVGMIAMTVDSTNPSQTLGYGVWALWGSGRVPVSFLPSDPDFGVVEGTGGSKTASIADHVHHTHDVTSNATTTPATVQSGVGATVVGSAANGTSTSTIENPTLTHVDGATGLPAIKTLPPFIVAYFWKRTA